MLVVILVSSLLNAAYFLPPVYRAFFSPAPEGGAAQGAGEAPRWCLVPPVLTALACIVLFFYPQPFLTLARMAAGVLAGSGG
jgi:multicomponent Na+:H+ antiporter subunit D